MKNLRRLFIVSLSATFVFASFTSFAENAHNHRKKKNWAENHPERARQAKERKQMYKEINQERKSGEITQSQANSLRKEVHQEGQEVRADARGNQNGGHMNGAQVKDTRQDLKNVQQDIQNAQHQ